MKAGFASLILFFAAALTPALAEIAPPEDDLSRAYEEALTALREGKEHLQIAAKLRPVVERFPESEYAGLARPLLADLGSSKQEKASNEHIAPEQRLSETRVIFALILVEENWHRLGDYIAKQPDDPVSQLISKGRAAIPDLIPLLADRTPTRSGPFPLKDWNTPQPRVCDFALALIEYHGKVRFHYDTSFMKCLHEETDDVRLAIKQRVSDWWAEVKDKSVAAGVRAQLLHARALSETVFMAKMLARLTDGQPTDDREMALNVLRDLVKANPRNSTGAYAADALAELSDTSPVDIFYHEWKSCLDKPGLIHDSHIAFYLCRHGGRREWELLYAISQNEMKEHKGPWNGAVWAAVVSSSEADTNPYAIPILGIALGHTQITGSRWVKDASQPFSYADSACEHFQKQVGRDFGYRAENNQEERLAAIQKAQTWWNESGKAEYTFDAIEKKKMAASNQ